eukprot:CAMPEP_0170610658 /NCGR_PEP_ID=MMETSP0224-20130122/22777_1 /TAXON_ID=285029 /ORGANISM="Togula jolla, Strain CCCM 725" /LENGTH=415 /DNA_ID=CAMNT_0010936049 /DNA_START=8 /DNA_END=1252 /DNA_ORIENTATION=+
MNYDKWDKLADSDEEEPQKHAWKAASRDEDERDRCKVLQDDIDRWLEKEISKLQREEREQSKAKNAKEQRPDYSNVGHGRSSAMGGLGSLAGLGGFSGLGGLNDGLNTPAESSRPIERTMAPYRQVSSEERKVLSMLVALSAFETGETNLTRHPEMLELARHHRWLEEDPGTLELLCRVHSAHMRRSNASPIPGREENEEDARMRNFIMCGINTLAAPKISKVSGGLLALITAICTPDTEQAKELRKKWQEKEFAKTAIFDSLFPDLRAASEEKDDDSMWEIWLLLGFVALIILGIIAFLIWVRPWAVSKGLARGSAAAAAAAKGAEVAGAGAVVIGETASVSAMSGAAAAAAAGPVGAALGAEAGTVMGGATDVASQLRTLEELHSSGVISQEVLEQARQRLSGRGEDDDRGSG